MRVARRPQGAVRAQRDGGEGGVHGNGWKGHQAVRCGHRAERGNDRSGGGGEWNLIHRNTAYALIIRDLQEGSRIRHHLQINT